MLTVRSTRYNPATERSRVCETESREEETEAASVCRWLHQSHALREGEERGAGEGGEGRGLGERGRGRKGGKRRDSDLVHMKSDSVEIGRAHV